MVNVAKVLKAEMTRISRKEAKVAVGEIGKSNVTLKKTVADLKRRVALLERENKHLIARERKQQAELPKVLTEEAKNARITSKGIRSLRSRWGLTRSDFAKLLGTTGHSVYLWERKEGALKLRGHTRAALLSVRGLGAREAKMRLAEAEAKSGRVRAMPPKKRKPR